MLLNVDDSTSPEAPKREFPEGASEPPDFAAGVGFLDALRELALRDASCGASDPLQRPQPEAHADPGRGGQHEDHSAENGSLDEQQLVEVLVGLPERDRDDCDLAVGSGLREDPVAAQVAGDRLQAADARVLWQRRRLEVGGVEEVGSEESAAGHASRRVATLPVGAERKPAIMSARSASVPVSAALPIGDTPDRADGGPRLIIHAVLQE